MKNNRDLAKAFGIVDTTWKKWSREFLPPDPASGKGRGRTRSYTPEDAFTVYLGGLMVSEKAMTFKESKEAIKIIISFMQNREYFPLVESFWQKRKDQNIEKWNVEITRTPEGSNYTIEHVIDEDLIDSYTSESGENCYVYLKRYETLPMKEVVTAVPICTVHLSLNDTIRDFVLTSKY